MLSHSAWLWALPLAAQAVRFTVEKAPQSTRSGFRSRRVQSLLASTCSDDSCGELGNTLDVVYFSNITVGGKQFVVQVDTGSSDLWVNATLQQPEATILQDVVVSNVYGDSSNYTGPVAFAKVEFQGLEVANQSFTYATISENDNTAQLNLTGLIGLSFDSISNNARAVAQATGDKTLGRTFLSNVFAANSSLEPFISFILSRVEDLNSTANTNGAFTIGEYEEGYESIQNEKPVPLFPEDTIQWTVAVDSISVNGNNIGYTSNVRGASNIVALLDTGTSVLLVPDQIAQSVYSSMSGVQSFTSQGQTTYIIPCETEPPKLVMTIGGSQIPVHPLDTSTVFQTFQTGDGKLISVCSGGIVGYSSRSNFGDSGFDLLLGDTFLRNSYTMFHFGANESTSTPSSSNQPSGPFIKIMGTTDPSTASSDFKATRQKQLQLAPAASSRQIQELLDGRGNYVPVDTPQLNNNGGSNGNGNNGGGNGNGSGGSNGGALSLRYDSLVIASLSVLLGAMLS